MKIKYRKVSEKKWNKDKYLKEAVDRANKLSKQLNDISLLTPSTDKDIKKYDCLYQQWLIEFNIVRRERIEE